MPKITRPTLSSEGLTPTHAVTAYDQYDEARNIHVSGESPLTLKVDDREVVTLMTLGTYPELLALGYLRNQRLLDSVEEITSVKVDWDTESVQVTTRSGKGISNWQEKLSNRTVTTGCGQGTIFSCTLDKLYDQRLPQVKVRQSLLYGLLTTITQFNEIYKQAGAVHGCALCQENEILFFVEDVGRHNAADAISGKMWLEDISGNDKIFYTTGRLTSEIVMKVTHMGIPILLSRSGVTHMGLTLAKDLGVTMIARAKGKSFLVYNGHENIIYDQKPDKPPQRQT
jgi:FdhD protein